MRVVDEERAEVVEMFAEAGLSLADAAEFIGAKRDTVHKWARRKGIRFHARQADKWPDRRERYGPTGKRRETRPRRRRS